MHCAGAGMRRCIYRDSGSQPCTGSGAYRGYTIECRDYSRNNGVFPYPCAASSRHVANHYSIRIKSIWQMCEKFAVKAAPKSSNNDENCKDWCPFSVVWNPNKLRWFSLNTSVHLFNSFQKKLEVRFIEFQKGKRSYIELRMYPLLSYWSLLCSNERQRRRVLPAACQSSPADPSHSRDKDQFYLSFGSFTKKSILRSGFSLAFFDN